MLGYLSVTVTACTDFLTLLLTLGCIASDCGQSGHSLLYLDGATFEASGVLCGCSVASVFDCETKLNSMSPQQLAYQKASDCEAHM